MNILSICIYDIMILTPLYRDLVGGFPFGRGVLLYSKVSKLENVSK